MSGITQITELLQENETINFLPEDAILVEHPNQGTWKIMVADDDVDVHQVTEIILKRFTFDGRSTEFLFASSGKEAIHLLEINPDTALIFLDVVMESETAGFDVVKHIRETLKNKYVRIILRTGQPGQAPEKVVIQNYDINDYKLKVELTDDKLFTAVLQALRTYKNLITLESLNIEIEETQREIILTLGEVAEARSNETGHHVKRVAEYSRILAVKYGLSEEACDMIHRVSPVHDLGKLAIPDAILNKPGKLTPEEFETMKMHSQIGFDMLKNSKRKILQTAAIIALQHHEKYDGTGYPQKLKGEAIHIYGRITAVADVFDALGSERVYKKAWELEKILALFKEERGQHFDPVLVDIFFENLDEILHIRDSFPDT